MKSKGLFICDIYNTYFCLSDDHNEERKKFVDNLVKIIIKDKLDILYFSFVTNDTIDYLENTIEDLKNHLPNKVKFMKQYYYNGYIYENTNYPYEYKYRYEVIDSLKNEYKVNNIYYADDSLFNHQLVKDKKIIHFINSSNNDYFNSNEKGLKGINEAIEKYLKTSSK